MAPNETCQSVSHPCVHTKCAWEMSASAVGSGEELLFVGENGSSKPFLLFNTVLAPTQSLRQC